MNYKSEINKLQSLVSEDTWNILVETNAIIAGGAITSVFCNRDVNDLDIYLRNESDFELFIDLVFDGSYSLIANNMTNRSIMFRDKETSQDVQLIVYKFFPTVDELFKDYDFTCNMGALEFVDEQPSLVLHEVFMKHNSQRYLEFNEGTAYPLISALRVQKYVEKGYFCPKAQFLRILLAVNKKNIDSWDKLKDEIGGMYGLNMDEIFNEDEEFSLESAMDTLNEIESDNNFVKFNESITKQTILDTIALRDVSDSSRIVADGKLFKNVMLNTDQDSEKGEDGTYQSCYNTKFKYTVGESVNGGREGVYCYDGYDVLTGIYSENGYILELEGGELKESSSSFYGLAENKKQLVGDVKVVNAYTRIQFIRKFKKGVNDD